MDKTDILPLLTGLPGVEKNSKSGLWEESIFDPFGMDENRWQYIVGEGDKIVVQKVNGNGTVEGKQTIDFRTLLWRKLRLDKVCEQYLNQYKTWQEQNSGVPFIPTKIFCDSDERGVVKSTDFIREFWQGTSNILALVMADYGMGKSSFCQGVRQEAGQTIKMPFLNGIAAFPFVFDLNEFRNQDVEEFIQNRLTDPYGLPITYKTFEKLCQAGIFCVVLDAWDQMHSTPYAQQVRQDILQFSPLWHGNGRVLITCRRTFYQDQLHKKRKHLPDGSPMKYARPYTLCGFDTDSVLQYIKTSNRAFSDDPDWIASCWNVNHEILERPLTLRLLIENYDLIQPLYDLEEDKIDAYQLFEVILKQWQAHYQMDDALKTLVWCTLRSGLNRSVSKEAYLAQVKAVDKDQILDALGKLVFVRCDERSDNSIEFFLAAYQEFLWAHFALQELNECRLCGSDTLLNQYLLVPEVRKWIVKILSQEQNNCLHAHLDLLPYKLPEEVGYSGGNALTLLGDLNLFPYYKEQLTKQNLAERPLQGTDLRGLDLRGLRFQGSSLARANLSYTKLDDTDFTGANLTDCEFEEYGSLKKCTFLSEAGSPCVVCGTGTGGVLTFHFADNRADLAALANNTIRDIAADSAGVYTASSDGYVGYIDKSGQLRHAYIDSRGLQSIVPGPADIVYIGADEAGLYSYNWKLASKQQIDIYDARENLFSVTEAASIRYFSSASNRCIAYLADRHMRLVLLDLEAATMTTAQVAGVGRLQDNELCFEDICFTDNHLVYAIKQRGVYSRNIERFFGNIDQNNLMTQAHLLLPIHHPVELTWAKDMRSLFVLEKKKHTNSVAVLTPSESGFSRHIREIYWMIDGPNFMPEPQNINGFCVSDNGKYLAIVGERLAVFSWDEENKLYKLVQEPIEAKISYTGAVFKHSTGLSNSMLEKLAKRGASI